MVPDFAEVYYYARHNDMRVLDGIWERIKNAAKGAALGTGTTVELDMTGAVWNVLPNSYLVSLMQKNLQLVGGYEYTPAERQFAEALRKTLDGELPPIDSANTVFTPEPGVGGASTDLGDVSWRVPTVQVTVGDVGAGHARPQLAGRGRWRHVHRREGDGGGGQEHDAHRHRPVHRPGPHREGPGGVRHAPRAELQVLDAARRPQAGAGLSEVGHDPDRGTAGTVSGRGLPPSNSLLITLRAVLRACERPVADLAALAHPSRLGETGGAMTYARLVVAGALALATTISAAQRPEAPYAFRYHSYAESTALLQGLAARYPRLARLSSLGRGAAGDREMWVLEIGNQDTGPAAEKPAVYFDGNQHATEVMGGEVTLHLAHYLLSRYGTDAEITRLIDTRVIYIVQRANPDGAEAYMTGRVDWDPARAPGQRDADGDGRKGEDGPEDVDGDGQILQMRVPDPGGDWTPYGRDARVLVRRRPADTAGPFYRVLEEGLDNDGDGRLNEDPPHTRFISNRNYPAFWASDDGRFRGEGDYPLQEPNSRRLVEFILGRPHISMVESFHTTSGVHLRPYAARPDTGFPVQDLHDYQAVLAKGAAITGYPAASVYNDFTDIQPGLPPDEQPGVRHGVFIDWAYVHAGLFAATTELWTMEPFLNEAGWDDVPRDKPLFAIPGRYNRPDVQAAVLRWLDARKGHPDLGGEGFVNWRTFESPDARPRRARRIHALLPAQSAAGSVLRAGGGRPGALRGGAGAADAAGEDSRRAGGAGGWRRVDA